jgi:polysaccharide biosynthesis PFTS motif protein
MEFNDSFKVENFIQQRTKKLLKNKYSALHGISSIISGRAGTHSCFREKASVNRLKGVDSNRKIKDQNSNDSILHCKKRCRSKTMVKATIYIFIVLVHSLVLTNFKKKTLPNVLVFSIPNQHQHNKELKDFLLEKRIKSHFQNKKIRILVQKRFEFWNGFQKNIESSMYLPLYLMRNYLRFESRLKIQALVIKNFIRLIKIKQCDPLLLCYKELIFEITLYEQIKFERKIDVVYTQSNLRTLSPISYVNSKIFTTRNIMIWYSTNSDLIYKNGVKPFKIQNNYLSLDRIDQHLVWDIYAKKTLAKMTNKQIFASGSLLFYPKKMQKKRVGENSYKVLVFDVTPAEGTTGEDFLNSSQAIETIREIVNAAHKFNSNSNKELNLFLKPKRRYSKSHSGEYIRYIAKLQRQKKIRLINYSSNLYEIINDADLVIGFPWTSPAAVANEIKVKSLYYISDREYNWNLMKRKNTVLLRKENDLYNFIKKNLVR